MKRRRPLNRSKPDARSNCVSTHRPLASDQSGYAFCQIKEVNELRRIVVRWIEAASDGVTAVGKKQLNESEIFNILRRDRHARACTALTPISFTEYVLQNGLYTSVVVFN